MVAIARISSRCDCDADALALNQRWTTERSARRKGKPEPPGGHIRALSKHTQCDPAFRNRDVFLPQVQERTWSADFLNQGCSLAPGHRPSGSLRLKLGAPSQHLVPCQYGHGSFERFSTQAQEDRSRGCERKPALRGCQCSLGIVHVERPVHRDDHALLPQAPYVRYRTKTCRGRVSPHKLGVYSVVCIVDFFALRKRGDTGRAPQQF